MFETFTQSPTVGDELTGSRASAGEKKGTSIRGKLEQKPSHIDVLCEQFMQEEKSSAVNAVRMPLPSSPGQNLSNGSS